MKRPSRQQMPLFPEPPLAIAPLVEESRKFCDDLRREIESPGVTLERLTQIIAITGRMQNMWAEYKIRNEVAAGRLLAER